MKAALLTLTAVASSAMAQEEILITTKLPVDERQVGSSVTVIDSETIEHTPYQSFTELLQSQGGISTSNNGGIGRTSALRIRGEESFRTRVYIDGIRMENITAPQALPQIEHILLDNIDRIEVLKGPQGLVYGADAGGVVSIITADPEPGFSGEASFEGSRYETHKAHSRIAYGGERSGVSFSVTDFTTDGFNARSDDLSNEKDGYENLSLHFKGYYHLNDVITLRAVFRNVEADDQYDNCGFPSSNDCEGRTDENIWRVSGEIMGERSQHQFGVSRTVVARDTFTDGNESFDTKGRSQLIDYTGRFTLTEELALLWGLEDYRQEAKTYFMGFESDLDDQQQSSAFLELQSNINDRWFATVGVRYDDNNTFGEHTSYRLTSAYLVPVATGEVKFRFSAGTGFRAPSLSEVAYPASPPASLVDLQEETSQGFDVGVSYQTHGGTFSEIIYFEQQIDDEIFFDLNTFSGYLQAEGESLSRGVELNVKWPLIKPLLISGNYTYNDTGRRDGLDRPLRPRHEMQIGALYRWVDKAALNVQWQAVRDVTGINQQPLDSYELLDASLYFYPNDYLTLYIKGNNLLDEDYEQVRNYNTSGPAYTLGIQADF